MGQRTQLFRLTKENKWETYHQQWGCGENMQNFFVDNELNKEYLLDETSTLFSHLHFNNNNGFLLIDDINKKYTFILGYEEVAIFTPEVRKKIDLLSKNYEKYTENLFALAIETPLTYMEYLSYDHPDVEVDQVFDEISYFDDYSLMSSKEVRNFLIDQAKAILIGDKNKFYNETIAVYQKHIDWNKLNNIKLTLDDDSTNKPTPSNTTGQSR